MINFAALTNPGVKPMQRTQLPNHSWLKDILFLTFILGGLFFILLGARPLFVPDEGRYAEIAREMVASGDYLTPHLNAIKYFEKPALFYWLEAAAIHLGGLNLWSIRSVNALLGLLGCLLTYGTARKLYDRNTGLLSAFILGTSALYFIMTHMVSLDLPVTIFLAATLYAFLLGIQQPPGNTRRLYLWSAAAAAACSVLTKGLIGVVFPGIIIAMYIALLGEWRLLMRLYLPSCLLIFLLIAAPWHILVGQQNPEFFYFYFIKQHFLRYTTLKIGHYQPAWFFIPNLIIGFFPWIVFLPQALSTSFSSVWQKRSEHKPELFFLIWAVFIFIFFSFSKSKLIPYILPIFPPLSILTARYLQQSITNKKLLGIKIGFACLFVMSIVISGVLVIFPHHTLIPDPFAATLYLAIAAVILMVGVIIAGIYTYKNLYTAFAITIAASGLFLLVSFSAMPYIDSRTIKPLTEILNSILTPQDEVIAYNQYFQDLPFYLQRRVTIVNWKNELNFGMEHQDTKEWMIDDDTFWRRWHSDKRIFALMGKKEYQSFIQEYKNERVYVVGATVGNVLISNKNINVHAFTHHEIVHSA